MLIPRRVKHRKQHHPRQRGIASGGTSVSFGDYGIQALEHAYITNRPDRVRSYRDQPTHQAWRQGVDQHLPGPSADQEARRNPHGFRKGIAGMVDCERQAGSRAVRAQLPQRADAPGGAEPARSTSCRSRHASLPERISSDGSGNFAWRLRELNDDELIEKLRESKEELFNLRFQMATGQMRQQPSAACGSP